MRINDEANPQNSNRSTFAALIPNLLSFARLVLGLAFPWLNPSWRVWALLGGAASDGLDGVISRKLHVATATGRMLDPIADKVLVMSVLLTILRDGTLEVWQVALVGSRDLAVLLGACFLVVTQGWSAMKRLPPSWLGKVTTAAQFAFLATVLYYEATIPVAFGATTVVSILAAVDYLRRYWMRQS